MRNIYLTKLITIGSLLIFASVTTILSAPDKPRDKKDRQPDEPQKYSIEQAISDQAQLHTIAFSALAFITGDFGAATFIPPGKVCDFFGFQYMRDIDAAQNGHNHEFVWGNPSLRSVPKELSVEIQQASIAIKAYEMIVHTPLKRLDKIRVLLGIACDFILTET